MKIHPSIVITKVQSRADADVIVNGKREYTGPSPDAYAMARSEGLWRIEVETPVPVRRTPRRSEWEWE